MKNVVLYFLLIAGMLAQVAPDYQPYSIENPDVMFPAAQLNFSIGTPIDFTQNALLTLQSDAMVYRLTLLFDSQHSGHLEIKNWQVPYGAMLFIFNDNSFLI